MTVIVKPSGTRAWSSNGKYQTKCRRPTVGHMNESASSTCAFLPGLQGPWTRLQMDILTQAYNTRLQNIVAAYNTTKSPAFAVVLDPLLSNTAIKEWDIEYLSSVDCFHPALNAHEVLARGVWRNLFRRSWEKDNRISPGGRKSHWCARERDRIATI